MCVHVFHIRFDTGPLIVIDLIEQILDNETLITPTNLNLKAVAFEIPKFHKAVVVSIGTLILKMPLRFPDNDEFEPRNPGYQ